MPQQTDHIGDTNKMVNMKLYTEEQVRKAMADSYIIGTDREDNCLEIEEYIRKNLTPIELPSDEELAILFHNKYEELAPEFKYETRMETKKFTKDSDNGKLMIAVCKEILQYLTKTNNMAQQTEFIPYKQALQLKELGFDENYFACYSEDGNLYMSEVWKRKNSIKAPLYQQAFRWFREKKMSDCCICRYQSRDDGGIYYYYVINHDFGVEETRHLKEGFISYEEAELACLIELIEIVKNK